MRTAAVTSTSPKQPSLSSSAAPHPHRPLPLRRAAIAVAARFAVAASSPRPRHPHHLSRRSPIVTTAKATMAPTLADSQAAAEQWLRIDPDPASRAQVEALLKEVASPSSPAATSTAELLDRFGGRLEFGTAGLRAKMGPGPARMNHVTVQQATQGLADYLLSPEGAAAAGFGGNGNDALAAVRNAGVVVGHDARHGSAHFARVAAAVLATKGIRVHLFPRIVPTPFVAAGVAFLDAAAGIMVTASHNTKEYNGYKVYWRGGSQIVPPVDVGIAAAIRRGEEGEGLWKLPAELLLADDAASVKAGGGGGEEEEGGGGGGNSAPPLITDPTHLVVPAYYAKLVEHLRFRSAQDNARALPCVYTPLHGVGLSAVERAFSEFGLPPPVIVAAQAVPDPEFPTVVFPNPEEGAGTWDLAFETGRAHNARLVLANDPDADRLAAAERDPSAPGGYRPFSGNEIGLLLADWVWRNRGGKQGHQKQQQAMMASAVSSRALASVARREGFRFEQTLTGFKWLGTVARRMAEEEGIEVLFAFEEAIGFMFPGTGVRDKDGVAAACAFAEMAAEKYSSGGGEGGEGETEPPQPQHSIAGRLEELYARYGRFCSRSGYFIADPPSKAAAVFDAWRASGGGDSSYPKQVGGLVVASVRDLGVGLDTSRPDGKPTLPWSPGDMMVTYELEDRKRGLRGALTVRGSGTEPKLKYYAEVWNEGPEEGEGGAASGAAAAAAAAAAQAAVEAVERAVADDLVRPEERGLKRKG